MTWEPAGERRWTHAETGAWLVRHGPDCGPSAFAELAGDEIHLHVPVPEGRPVSPIGSPLDGTYHAGSLRFDPPPPDDVRGSPALWTMLDVAAEKMYGLWRRSPANPLGAAQSGDRA